MLQNNLADEIVHGQLVKEIILQGNDRLPVSRKNYNSTSFQCKSHQIKTIIILTLIDAMTIGLNFYLTFIKTE